jgi:predicted transcriptional regulator
MMRSNDLVTLTADIATAYVSNNEVAATNVPKLVESIHQALAALEGQEQKKSDKIEPAVSVRASIKQSHLVCLACGAKQKTLKRHILAAHGLTPHEYRERFGLRSDYPMTAPDYSKLRGEMAKAAGLGRQMRQQGGDASSADTSAAAADGVGPHVL